MKTVTLEIPETPEDVVSFILRSGKPPLSSDMVVQETCKLTDYMTLSEGIYEFLKSGKYLQDHSWYLEPMIRSIFASGKYGTVRHKPKKHMVSGFEAYDYIPLTDTAFLDSVANIIPAFKEKIRFVDAGCGIGDKVRLVQRIFSPIVQFAEGIEYDRDLIKQKSTHSILEGDITKTSFERYNLIYAYNPMIRADGMKAFFQNVINTAVNGTFCVFHNVYSGEEAMDSPGIREHFKPAFESKNRWGHTNFVLVK